MDALKFLNGQRRLCNNFNNGCAECPLYRLSCYTSPSFRNEEENENMIYEVEQWVKDHPTKTRQSEFLKMFPNAFVDNDGVLDILPCGIDMTVKGTCAKKMCTDCRREFWLQDVK